MVPFEPSAAGCGARAVAGGTGAGGSCSGVVEATGLLYFAFPRPGSIWQVFACAQHRGWLVAPRALLPRDVELLECRRRGVVGARPRACGREARDLLAAARAWKARALGRIEVAAPETFSSIH